MNLDAFAPEIVALADLTPHPRNYRDHPDDQIAHIVQSIREHGIYRNIVIAQDGTILAGHGVVKALRTMGETIAPVKRLPYAPDHPKALKVLTGDNEISHLGQIDDRVLSEILKDIKETDLDGLLGTGYDEMMLANLVYVSRPASEIQSKEEAAQWVGMPEYEEGETAVKLIITFENAAAREEFMSRNAIPKLASNGTVWSTTWPPRDRYDRTSLRFEG